VLIRENFREYLDHLLNDGYSVKHDEHGSDPDLIDPGGNPIVTWQEEYPYPERLAREVYEEEKYKLQIELLKFQYWTQDVGGKHVILFEGRDAAVGVVGGGRLGSLIVAECGSHNVVVRQDEAVGAQHDAGTSIALAAQVDLQLDDTGDHFGRDLFD